MKIVTVAEQLMYSTVRIQTKLKNGSGLGTAFAYDYLKDGKPYSFLVTNKHVVRDSDEGLLHFTLSHVVAGEEEPLIGTPMPFKIHDFESCWFPHPIESIDIAVLPAAPIYVEAEKGGKRPFLTFITSDLAIHGEELEDLDAVEPIVFVGYPNGAYDKKNLTPIIRRGTTATHPGLDYSGEKGFLVDASIFHGSSGSPVFLYNTGTYAVKGKEAKGTSITVGNRLRFLGVLSRAFSRTSSNTMVVEDIPAAEKPSDPSKQMIDLGFVYKADLVNETVEAFLAKAKAVASA